MESSEISILVDPESITQCRSGKYLGVIRWRIDQNYFPSELWDDFVVILLMDWIQTYIRLLSRTTRSEVLYFMDGPFYVRCRVVDDEVFCKFIESRASGKEIIEDEWHGDLQVVAKSLVNAAKIVLTNFDQVQKFNKDLHTLASRLLEIQKYL